MATPPIVIGMPIYPGFDLLDIAGPWEMFKWAGYTIELVAETPGLIACNPPDQGLPVQIEVATGLAGASKWDAMWTPGGAPLSLNTIIEQHPAFLAFLEQKSREVKYVCSVCEGALLLAAAKLLDGYTITTHWAFIACFQQRYGQVKLADGFPRFCLDRDRLTGGGISSGLDEALKLIELLSGADAARGVQQNTQYYPDPPVSSLIPQNNYCPLDAPDAQPKTAAAAS